MSRAAIILACLVLAGCESRKSDAISALHNVTRDCDAQSVRYRADASGPVREFVLTCEVPADE